MTLAPPGTRLALTPPGPPPPPRAEGALAWLAAAPPARVPPALAAAALAAGAACRLVGAAWYYPVAVTALAALAAAAVAAWCRRRRPGPGYSSREVAAAAALAGGWVAVYAAVGAWWLLALPPAGIPAGRRWLARHRTARWAAAQAGRAARAAEREAAERAEKAAMHSWWAAWAPGLGLDGTVPLSKTPTLLGDHWVIDITPAGLLSSAISFPVICELWAQREGLPMGRVNAYFIRSEPAGRLHINVRREDPWAEPPAHPAFDPGSIYAASCPDPGTATRPLGIGADPEHGTPLGLTAWDANGGKVILIMSSKGAGKTVLMNCVTAALTAALDAVVIQLNLIKPREETLWEPACHLTVLGSPGDQVAVARARRALAWAVGEMSWRAANLTGASKVRPSRANPLIAIKADELAALHRDWVCARLLNQLGEACRSEALAIIAAAQTRRAEHIGALFRALVDVTVTGRFNTPAEAKRAADGLDLPDMRDYGEGAEGVWAVTDLAKARTALGRTFHLEDPAQIRQLAAARAARVQPPVMHTPELAALWAEASGTAPLTPRWEDESYLGGEPAGPPAGTRPGGPGTGPPGGAGTAGPGTAGPGTAGTGTGGRPGTGAGQVRNRVSAALDAAAGTDREIPGLDDEARGRYLADREARRAAYLEEAFGSVEIPAGMAHPLLALLARPGGVSSRESAKLLLGNENSRNTTLGWIKHLELAGLAGPGGPRNQYTATEAGAARLAELAAAGDESDPL
jgi:hypothetical protein